MSVSLLRVYHHADEHTFWTLSATPSTNAATVCRVVADKLNIDTTLTLCTVINSKGYRSSLKDLLTLYTEKVVLPTEFPLVVKEQQEKKNKKSPVKFIVKPAQSGDSLPTKPLPQLSKTGNSTYLPQSLQPVNDSKVKESRIIRVYLGDEPDMHTFWTLSLGQNTTAGEMCKLLSEKLSLPPDTFSLCVLQDGNESLMKEEDVLLPIKTKKDFEGGQHTFVIRRKGANTTAPPTTQSVTSVTQGVNKEGTPAKVNSPVVVIPSVAEQIRAIYARLAVPGNIAPGMRFVMTAGTVNFPCVASTDWEMLVALLNSQLPLAVEISLKLLINVTAEVCGNSAVMSRLFEIGRTADFKLREIVAWLLNNLAVHPDNLPTLATLGAVGLLVPNLAPENTEYLQTLKALITMTRHDANKKQLISQLPAGATSVVSLLQSSDPQISNLMLQLLVNLGLNEGTMRHDFVEAGGLDVLIHVLRTEISKSINPTTARLSVWLMANLNHDGHYNNQMRVNGALPLLVLLVNPGHEEFVRAHAAATLTNLAVNSEANMDAIRESGAIPPLIELLVDVSCTEETHQRAVWALSNLLVSENCHEPFVEAKGLQAIISTLGRSNHPGVLMLCADALGNITQYNDFIRKDIGEQGAVPLLLKILSSKSTRPEDIELKEHVLRALINLAHNGTRSLLNSSVPFPNMFLLDDNEERILNAQGVPTLSNFLGPSNSRLFQKYATMTLVNLSLNEKVRVASRVSGAIQLVVDLLKKSTQIDPHDSLESHVLKLLTNLAINGTDAFRIYRLLTLLKLGKNRRILKEELQLLDFLQQRETYFKQHLEKEYSMVVNNLSFITSSQNEKDDDEDERIFMDYLAKPVVDEEIQDDGHTVEQEEDSPPTPVQPAAPVKSEAPQMTPEQHKKNEERRHKIVTEILTTEKSYVHGLSVLVKKFMNAVEGSSKSKKPLVAAVQVTHIFSIADVLLNYHSMFLEGLGKRILKWSDTQLIGDFFVEMGFGLKMYTEYVNNYNRALLTLQECMKKPLFIELIKKVQSADNLQELESYLILPIQRYQLLLQDLIRHTANTHGDYKNLGKALDVMKELALHINETERSWSKVKGVQDSIQGKFRAFAGANRQYIKEGATLMNNELHYLFLLNDLMILTKPLPPNTKSRYKYKFIDRIDINDIEAKDTNSPNSFRLLVYGEKLLSLVFTSASDKNDWYQAIKKCEARGRRRSVNFAKLT